jgi:hypothetical protein
MPLRALVAALALFIATIAGQNALFHSDATATNTDATSCDREACTPAFPGADYGTVLGHEVLAGGCPSGDLHVMRYVPGTSGAPLVATWCR